MYYLDCIYDGRKSFYNKAKVIINEDEGELLKRLHSYDTLVAIISTDKKDNTTTYMLVDYDVNGREKTPTTMRHQREFFRQAGLTDDEIKELFKKGVLIKNE